MLDPDPDQAGSKALGSGLVPDPAGSNISGSGVDPDPAGSKNSGSGAPISETADFAPGAAAWRPRPNNVVCDVRLVPPHGELDEAYASFLILAYTLHYMCPKMVMFFHYMKT